MGACEPSMADRYPGRLQVGYLDVRSSVRNLPGCFFSVDPRGNAIQLHHSKFPHASLFCPMVRGSRVRAAAVHWRRGRRQIQVLDNVRTFIEDGLNVL